jgi:hypothetical protein
MNYWNRQFALETWNFFTFTWIPSKVIILLMWTISVGPSSVQIRGVLLYIYNKMCDYYQFLYFDILRIYFLYTLFYVCIRLFLFNLGAWKIQGKNHLGKVLLSSVNRNLSRVNYSLINLKTSDKLLFVTYTVNFILLLELFYSDKTHTARCTGHLTRPCGWIKSISELKNPLFLFVA